MNKRANGGKARAAKLSPEQRKTIASNAAKKRWGEQDGNPSNLPVQQRKASGRQLIKQQIITAVLTGLYANLDNTTKFIAHHTPDVFREGMTLQEACNKIAVMQANETVAYLLEE